jgi:putative ABC transport system permease protein
VAAAGAISLRPLEHGPIGSDAWVLTEGTPLDQRSVVAGSVSVNWQVATPDYFRAVGTRLIAGRGFSEADAVDAPKVVVVSESVARRCWPGEAPIGKRLHTHGASITFENGRFSDVEWMTVVGVVEDARYRGIQRPRPAVYLSYRQAPSLPRHYVVRAQGDPLAVIGAAREAARSLDRTALVGDVATLESLVARALVPWRFAGSLLTGFASVALLLTVSGLLGVLYQFVTLRTREIAIRMAVGATPGNVTRRVLAQGLAMTLLGLAVGIAASLGLAGSLAALLYGVSGHDPWSYLGASAVIVGLATLACWLPARRAAATDPIVVLRAE